MTETVIVRTRKPTNVYHTDPDCRQIPEPEHQAEKPLSLVKDRLKECAYCQGKHPQGHRHQYEILKELGVSEVVLE